MRRIRIAKILVFTILLLVWGYATPVTGEETREPMDILIVTSYEMNHDWSNRVISQFVKELRSSPLDIYYHIEYSDGEKIKHKEEYYQDLLQKLRRYDQIDLDGIVVIGYEAFVVMDRLLSKSDIDIPLIVGGVNQHYLSQFVHYPHTNMSQTAYSADYFVDGILAVQPELEKVYFWGQGPRMEYPYGLKVVEELKNHGIIVQYVDEEYLSLIHREGKNTDEGKYFTTEEKETGRMYLGDGIYLRDIISDIDHQAMLVSTEMWDEQGNWIDPVALFDGLQECYLGPIYWMDGMQFYRIAELREDINQIIGTNIFDIQQEAENMASNLMSYLEEENSYKEMKPVEKQLLLNYKGLRHFNLYQEGLANWYTVMGVPKVVISIPWHLGILFLIGIIVWVVHLIHILHEGNKRKEYLLAQSNQSRLRYSQLLSNLSDGMIKVSEGKIQYINQNGQALLEDGPMTLQGRNITEIFDQYDWWVDLGQGKGLEHAQLKVGQRVIEVEINWVNFPSEPGSRLLVIHDLTEEQKSQEELERCKMKMEFFSTLSHEFKTPLNLILSTSQLVAKRVLRCQSTALLEYNKIIKYNGHRLERIINNLLDTTKVNSGFMELHLQPIDFIRFTDQLVHSINPMAKKMGITIRFLFGQQAIYGLADHEKYERIILNLLSNGIKYNRLGGEVNVSIWSANQEVIIKIHDNGRGIPKDEQKEIFQPFKRVSEEHKLATEGSGLGLTIVQSFVELHHGRITLDSVEGKYSEFTIVLPQGELTAEQEQPIKENNNYLLFAMDSELADLLLDEVGDPI